MTVHETEASQSNTGSSNPDRWDDEIDLRQYLDVLLQWWREIVLMAVLCAVIAGLAAYGLRQLQDPQYQSSSDVVMARVISIATLDERFQTLSGENSSAVTSSVARRSALVGLAKSGAIAQAVIDELGVLLNEDEQNPANLLEVVAAAALPSSDSRTQSDLIRISATADDPVKAAAIANAWARHYVAQINDLFGQAPIEIVESVEAELIQSDSAYQSAQRALEEYISADRSNELTRQITEKQAQLDALQSGREAALTTIIDQELSTRLNLFANLVDARTSSAEAVLVEQIERRLVRLSQLHAARNRSHLLAEQSRALLAQIEAGGDAAAETNALALQLLKAQAFAAAADTEQIAPDPEKVGMVSQSRQTTFALPADLQLILPSGEPSGQDAEAQAADVVALAEALEAHVIQLDEQIEELSGDLLTGDDLDHLVKLGAVQGATNVTAEDATGAEMAEDANDTLQAAIQRSYEQLFDVGAFTATSQRPGPTDSDDALTLLLQQIGREIQMLQAQLEAETARLQQLTQQRDLAWNTYDTLSNKVAELMLERTATNSEVRLGSPAIPPTRPIAGPSLSLVVPIAAALGFMVGVLVAFIATYLGYEPFLSRRKPIPA